MSFSRALFSGANILSVSLRPLRPFTLEHETSIVSVYIYIYTGGHDERSIQWSLIYIYICVYTYIDDYIHIKKRLATRTCDSREASSI